jgi:hypothetical protein
MGWNPTAPLEPPSKSRHLPWPAQVLCLRLHVRRSEVSTLSRWTTTTRLVVGREAAASPGACESRCSSKVGVELPLGTIFDSAAFARASSIALAGEGRVARIARVPVAGVKLHMHTVTSVFARSNTMS